MQVKTWHDIPISKEHLCVWKNPKVEIEFAKELRSI